MRPAFFVLSGCSGGGKSTLIQALADAGYAVVPEPGRRVIRAGGPTPQNDLPGFLLACLDIAVADYYAALALSGPVFFDRSVLDAISGLEVLDHPGREDRSALMSEMRYAPDVFMAPPWPNLFAPDGERQHGFQEACAEYDRLIRDYPAAGYRLVTLKRAPIAARMAQVLGVVRATR